MTDSFYMDLMKKLNGLQEQINALRTIEIGGVWTAYTPTWTAPTTNPTIGNGTLTGRYAVIGKVCHAMIYLSVGDTTTIGSGAYSFTYPIAPVSGNYVGGTWLARDVTGNAYTGVIYGNVDKFALANGGSLYVTAVAPFKFADTDFIRIFLTYEIA